MFAEQSAVSNLLLRIVLEARNDETLAQASAFAATVLSALPGFSFSALDLQRVSLHGARLENTLLFGANLEEADLRTSSLTNSDLRYARLEGASIGGCSFGLEPQIRTTAQPVPGTAISRNSHYVVTAENGSDNEPARVNLIKVLSAEISQ